MFKRKPSEAETKGVEALQLIAQSLVELNQKLDLVLELKQKVDVIYEAYTGLNTPKQ